MIYLLTQILLCLAFAAVLGGAIGWLWQRSRAEGRLAAARRALAAQGAQLERARTDIAMLSDDFDDLRERSRTEIDALRQENRQLPVVTENLEKSQLLVRQLMQRHESQVRELDAAKAVLEERIAHLQEQVVTQERALVAAARTAQGRPPPPVDGPTITADRDADDGPATSADGTDPGDGNARSLPRRGWASLPLGGADGAEAGDGLMDEVMEVDDDFAAELREHVDASGAPADGASAGTPPDDSPIDPGAVARPTEPDPSGDGDPDDDGVRGDVAAGVEGVVAGTAIRIDADSDDADEDDEHDDDDLDDWDDEEANATLAIEVFSMDDVHGVDDIDMSDPVDGTTPAPLFRPVERQDDLQRIDGISPLTERTLNELGITSYPQLAGLERPEIERIAAVLDIEPERIERDDWVGNARRQLEDVLEEL